MNYLNKIFNYIKVFFDRKTFKEKINSNEENLFDINTDLTFNGNTDNDIVAEDTVIEEVIEENELEQAIKQLKFGDIIMANRYKNEEEKEKIPVGHRVGPAIVLSNENNKLICVFGTGVEPEIFVSENSIFNIEPGNYNLTKKTYFSVGILNEIEYDAVEEVLGKMNSDDIKKFTKKYVIMRNRGAYKNKKTFDFNIPLETGDLFKYNQELFLIIDVKDNRYICFKLKIIDNIINKNSILIDKKFYNINYKEVVSISKNVNSVIISALNSNQLVSILKRYEEYISNQNNQTIAQRGSIIKKDGTLYFIYGENGNKWLTFKVFENMSKGSKYLKVNNKYYYTNFISTEVNKNDDYDVLCLATKDEINVIINLKKEYKRQRKVVDKKYVNKNKKFNFPNFLPGEVVKTKTMCDDKYIIIARYDKGVYCANINNIKKGNFRAEYFDIKLLVSIGKISNKYYNIVNNNSIELKEDIKKLELKF